MTSKWKGALELKSATKVRVVTTLSVSLGASAIRADHPAIVVAPDGSGHFKTVQSAIDSIPDKNTESRVIVIKPGIYKERLLISESKTFITLRGEHKHAAKTVLTFNRYWGMEDPEAPGKKVETNDVESVSIHADNFTAENITFENSAGEVGQAPAVRTTRRQTKLPQLPVPRLAGHALRRRRANVFQELLRRGPRGFHLWRCDGCFRKLPYPQ